MTNTVLWALIALANGSITVNSGYASKAECSQAFKGGTATCISYNPDGSTWMMMFYRPTARGSIKLVRRIPDEAECQNYLGTLKPGVPAVCKRLDVPIDCDPAVSEIGGKGVASAASNTLGADRDAPPLQLPKSYPSEPTKPFIAVQVPWVPDNNIQVNGGRYTRSELAWIAEERAKETVTPVEVTPRPTDVAHGTQRQQPGLGGSYAMQPNPFQVFLDVIGAPLFFVSYPARRDW